MNDVNIESARFILRSLTTKDASKKYLDWLNEGLVKKYITYAEEERTLDDLRAYIYEKTERQDTLFLGIFLKDDLSHIGNIKYEPIDTKSSFAIMGILIGEVAWQGKGVGPEVIEASAKWLQAKMGIKQIALGVDIENEAAIKAYEKIGFIVSNVPYLETQSNTVAMLWAL